MAKRINSEHRRDLRDARALALDIVTDLRPRVIELRGADFLDTPLEIRTASGALVLIADERGTIEITITLPKQKMTRYDELMAETAAYGEVTQLNIGRAWRRQTD